MSMLSLTQQSPVNSKCSRQPTTIWSEHFHRELHRGTCMFESQVI